MRLPRERLRAQPMIRAALTIILSIGALGIYALDHGLYVGSVDYIDGKPVADDWIPVHAPGPWDAFKPHEMSDEDVFGGKRVPLVTRKCRHLFITGITEMPALGGLSAQIEALQGVQPMDQIKSLHCRMFGE